MSLSALGAALLFTVSARADPGLQISASVGLGELAVGAGLPRFALVPTASVLFLRGERWLFRCDDALTLLGATGGRFGVANATTFSFGARWEEVTASAGLSLAEYSLSLCGAGWCGQVRGLSPGVDARLEVFRTTLLRGALGLSANCGTLWIVGRAASMWSGFSTRCTLGPILRLSSR